MSNAQIGFLYGLSDTALFCAWRWWLAAGRAKLAEFKAGVISARFDALVAGGQESARNWENKAIQNAIDLQATRASLFVPGMWYCPECKFEQMNSIMYVRSGNIGADMKLETRPCPNDGSQMCQMTWELHAKGAIKMGLQQCDRATAAELQVENLVSCFKRCVEKWRDDDSTGNVRQSIPTAFLELAVLIDTDHPPKPVSNNSN